MSIFHSDMEFIAPPDTLTIPEFILDGKYYQHPTTPSPSGDGPSLIDDSTGRSVHFNELRSRTQYLSAALHESYGIQPNDVVALISFNEIDYPVCIWAVHRVGGIIAPLGATLTTGELTHQLGIAKPSAIIVQKEGLPVASAAAAAAGIEKCRMILINGAAALNSDDPPSIEYLINRGKLLPPFYQRPLAPGGAKTKLAFLNFSSGTTGLPKESEIAVCISHYNAVSSILQTATCNRINDPKIPWDEKRYRPGDVCALVIPMNHIYGLIFNLHFIIYAQMTLVISPKFNFEKMLDSISRYRVTNLTIVPPQALLLCKHPAVPKYDISSVRVCIVAGAPVSAQLTQDLFHTLPGIHLGQGYGLTETCGGVSAVPVPMIGVLGSVGTLAPGTSAKVVKRDGSLAGVGEPGELYVKGPQVTLGYYKNEKETKDTFTADGWIRTGDEVYFASDRNIFIVDRVKELIKVKGLQVAPAELEGHLLSHNDVADAGVIGVPDDFAGELPFAFIVLKAEVAQSIKSNAEIRKKVRDSIFQHVAMGMSPYKRLAGGIEFVDAIPKSPSGKILRRLLREQASRLTRAKL